MTRFAYLIFSYKNPGQVLRLAAAIHRGSPLAHVVIHHDISKSQLRVPAGAQFHLIPNPVAVEWGDFSQIEMFLHSTEWMLNNLRFDWLVVLSGQDYPLKPLEAFEARLASSGYDAYLEHFPALTATTWPEGTGKRRYYLRYFKVPRIAPYYLLPESLRSRITNLRYWLNDAQSFINIRVPPGKSGARLGVRRLTVPFNRDFICYGGADWFNLNLKSVQAVHKFAADHPGILDYYRATYVPSESFVPTVLANSPGLRLANDSCRYVAWVSESAANPRIIRTSDLDEVCASGQPFARKFDAQVDANVLDLLDARVEKMMGKNGT